MLSRCQSHCWRLQKSFISSEKCNCYCKREVFRKRNSMSIVERFNIEVFFKSSLNDSFFRCRQLDMRRWAFHESFRKFSGWLVKNSTILMCCSTSMLWLFSFFKVASRIFSQFLHAIFIYSKIIGTNSFIPKSFKGHNRTVKQKHDSTIQTTIFRINYRCVFRRLKNCY